MQCTIGETNGRGICLPGVLLYLYAGGVDKCGTLMPDLKCKMELKTSCESGNIGPTFWLVLKSVCMTLSILTNFVAREH